MKTSSEVRRIKRNAEEFAISPELAWLMEVQPLWDELKRVCVETNRGVSLDTELDAPVDRLRSSLLVLASLLEERRG